MKALAFVCFVMLISAIHTQAAVAEEDIASTIANAGSALDVLRSMPALDHGPLFARLRATAEVAGDGTNWSMPPTVEAVSLGVFLGSEHGLLNESQLRAGARWLLFAQHSSGGWPRYAPNDPPDARGTALAALALYSVEYSTLFPTSQSRARALEFAEAQSQMLHSGADAAALSLVFSLEGAEDRAVEHLSISQNLTEAAGVYEWADAVRFSFFACQILSAETGACEDSKDRAERDSAALAVGDGWSASGQTPDVILTSLLFPARTWLTSQDPSWGQVVLVGSESGARPLELDHVYFQPTAQVAEQVTITVTVANPSTVSQFGTVVLLVNGVQRGSAQAWVGSKSAEEFGFSITPVIAGTFRVTARLVETGETLAEQTLTVHTSGGISGAVVETTPPPTGPPVSTYPPTTGPTPEVPAPSMGLLFAVVGLAAVVLRWRQR